MFYPNFSHTFMDMDFMDSLKPTGMCDLSGAMVYHEDLRKEYVWAGDDLAWTGRMVYKDFLPIPNELTKTPPVFPDPEPVDDARPNPFLFMDMTEEQ